MSDQKDLSHWRGLHTDADGNHYLGTGQQVQDPNQENYTYYLGLDQILPQVRPRDVETGTQRELHHADEPLFRTQASLPDLLGVGIVRPLVMRDGAAGSCHGRGRDWGGDRGWGRGGRPSCREFR